MRVLIAPNPFKHCLSGPQVAEALACGFREAGWQVDCLPLADGGPGTLDALQAALGCQRRYAQVQDALGRPVRAAWLKLGPLAVIESAQVIGLEMLGRRRQPLRASSEGLGQLLKLVQRAGCKEAWLGLGGSSSTDGGTGMARALGWRFLDAKGQDLKPGGVSLVNLVSVQAGPQLTMKVYGLCDVGNPLVGLKGAARVFAPQKGANAAQVILLENGLKKLQTCVSTSLARQRGAGAAGGLGFGILSFARGQLQSGADSLLQLTGFKARLQKADWVVTGEGRLDSQTRAGKLPARILAAAKEAGKPCLLIVGESLDPVVVWKRRGARAVYELRQGRLSRKQSIQSAPALLKNLALKFASEIR